MRMTAYDSGIPSGKLASAASLPQQDVVFAESRQGCHRLAGVLPGNVNFFPARKFFRVSAIDFAATFVRSTLPWFHADRAAGGNRNHRHPDFAAAASRSAGPRGRSTYAVQKQHEADWTRTAQLSRRASGVSAEQHQRFQHGSLVLPGNRAERSGDSSTQLCQSDSAVYRSGQRLQPHRLQCEFARSGQSGNGVAGHAVLPLSFLQRPFLQH